MSSLAASELKGADFGDKRLNKRAIKMAEDLSRQPEKSIPQHYNKSWGDVKGCYRFFDNGKVTPHEILNPHLENTLKRIKSLQVLLLVHDTSGIEFSKHTETEGLGYLEGKYLQGIKLHSTMAITPEGIPLGIITQEMWERDNNDYGKKHKRKQKPIQEKESYRWIESRDTANKILGDNIQKIHIADRESDIYEFITMSKSSNDNFIIRMNHNRRISQDHKKIKEYISETLIKGRYKVKINRSNRRKARTAQLEIRYANITLKPPANKTGHQTINVTVIYALEKNAPPKEPAIEWYLMTDLEIATMQQACQCLEYYSRRWLIERYFYVLKSGCKIEDLQLRKASRLENAIALYSVISWILMWIQYFARVDGNKSYKNIFSEKEMLLLYSHTYPEAKELPNKEPTIADMTLWLSILGGFINRKSDGAPGIKSLWRGYSIFIEVLYFFEKVRNSPIFNSGLMGNA